MSFYGNMTSVSKTQFEFDKIYQNRVLMDASAANDGVFIGRFVLVKYDANPGDSYITAYTEDYTSFYTSPNFEEITKINPVNNIIIKAVKEGEQNTPLYRGNNGVWTEVSSKDSEYVFNYNTDINFYGPGRGFDSTVWQKVYTNDEEKYVMIAELNSVVPTFGISADAPSMIPITPHFDERSTNVYYNLHWQTPWGFRIKDAAKDPNGSDGLEYLSDEKATWKNSSYNEDTGEITTTSEVINGAIYYNKDGFNPKVRSHIDNLENHIKIEPTGKSGLKYNNHTNDGTTSIQPDIQEVSIMLPSIGNTISDFWDLTYGKERNLDIKWGSTEGLRLVKEREGANGFDYVVNDVQTVAGVINSVHDLMGQIIIDDIPTDLKDLDEEAIYYSNDTGSYYRKFTNYEYNEINDVSSIANNQLYKEAGDLIDYVPGTYYTAHESKDYYLEKRTSFYKNKNYYNVEMEETPLSIDYKPGVLYYKAGTSYLLENSENARNIKYYSITDDSGSNLKFYKKDYFFYKNDSGAYVRDSNESMTVGRNYYTIEGGKTTIIIVEKIDEQGNAYYEEQTVNTGGEPKLVFLVAFEENKYYFKDNNKNYTLMVNSDIKVNSYHSVYTLTIVEQPTFYSSGVYYYKQNDNYIFDKLGNEYNKDRVYYTKKNIIKVSNFYYPNGFYYLENGEYILDSNQTLTAGRTYYVKNYLYVIDDINGIFTKGMIWNETKNPPEGLTVGFREDIVELKELEGFARTVHTIHGMILYINSLLNDVEEDTRNTSTVKGCINYINDILAIFGDLTPGKILITDEYGRINGAELLKDDWINVNIDDNISSSKVSFEHENPQAAISTLGQVNNETLSFGSSFKSIQVGIDEKGHVSELEEKTITLPSLSLEESGVGVLTNLELDSASGKVEVEYTNIKDLLLTDYVKSSEDGVLLATDSVEKAFGKIENNIDTINGTLSTLSSNLNSETSERKSADSSLGEQINSEVIARQNAVAGVSSDVQTLSNKVSQIETSVSEISAKVEENATNGLLRWYRQETEPTDTNSIWFNTLDNNIKIYNGTAWVSLLMA